jgi:hypothetical protein
MKLKTALITWALFTTSVFAGDAETKQQLAGTWNMGGGEIAILGSDGSRIYQGIDSYGKPFKLVGKWNVQGGTFIEIRMPPEGDRYYTIIKVTKHQFTLKDNAHGRHTGTWTR